MKKKARFCGPFSFTLRTIARGSMVQGQVTWMLTRPV
jgi:hypothetical protein